MRKLALSLCVIAASGAYVAKATMTEEDGVPALLERLSFQPSSPALNLDHGAPPDDGHRLLPLPVASPGAAVPAEGTTVAVIDPLLALPSSVANAAEAGPAPSVVTPLPRVAPLPLVAAPAAVPPPAAVPIPPSSSRLHDGTYTGTPADAYFGPIQVRAHVEGGKLRSVEVLTYPASRRASRRINDYALPVLEREVISAQDAEVDIVSGATLTAVAYMRSLRSALGQAM